MRWDRERLVRAGSAASATRCAHGLTPRKGKTALRLTDCTVDCKDEAGCLARRKQVFPGTTK